MTGCLTDRRDIQGVLDVIDGDGFVILSERDFNNLSLARKHW